MAHFDARVEGEAVLSRDFTGINSARRHPSLGRRRAEAALCRAAKAESYGVAGSLALHDMCHFIFRRDQDF